MAVYRVGMHGLFWARLMVRHNLVAEEIEINPLVGAATLRATQHCAVKVTCGLKVIHRKGDMERTKGVRHDIIILRPLFHFGTVRVRQAHDTTAGLTRILLIHKAIPNHYLTQVPTFVGYLIQSAWVLIVPTTSVAAFWSRAQHQNAARVVTRRQCGIASYLG